MTNWEDFEEFIGMDPEDRDEKLGELLEKIIKPWLNTPEEELVMGLVLATRAFIDAATKYAQTHEDAPANRYVMGCFVHASQQQMRNFQTLVGLSDMKRALDGKGDG